VARVEITPTTSEPFDPWLSTYHWTNSVLTYSFPAGAASVGYKRGQDIGALGGAQRDAVRAVLDSVSSFTGLSFEEIPETKGSVGVLRFARDNKTFGSYAYLPAVDGTAGDCFFGTAAKGPVIGNEAYLYFLHEIGHTIGLNHPHEFPDFQVTGMDSQEYTIMTYTDYVGDADLDAYDSGPVDWAHSFMQLDIAALQFLYGANYAETGEIWSGDTVYRFDPGTGEMSINGAGQGTPVGNRIFRTIWDGDGEDTYDLSNYLTDMRIDLRAGAFSTFSQDQLADLNQFSPAPRYLAEGNVANARLVDGDQRALIENAIGGAGDDKLTGNAADNRLDGGRGDDRLWGFAGNDHLNGGAGNDKLVGGAGNDRLVGAAGRDDLSGEAGDDRLFSGGGADALAGGRGHDVMHGGWGSDRMVGSGGNDRIFGGAGNDTIWGGRGRDVIEGGSGIDQIWGGSGNDTFVYIRRSDAPAAAEVERIMDFTSGEDLLDFSKLAGGTLRLALDGEFIGDTPSVASVEDETGMMVMIDSNGDGDAEMMVLLAGVTSLAAGDIIL